MSLIADILLIAGALGAAFYCLVLSRRLSRLSSLEDGVGGAIAGLSEQVAGMNAAIDRAQQEAETASRALADGTARAEAAARRLELLLASLHDLPDPGETALPGGRAAPSPAREPDPVHDGVAHVSATRHDQEAPAQNAVPIFRRRFGAPFAREAAQ